jgi:acyl carrier protein
MPEIYSRLHGLFLDRLHVDVPAAETDLLESGSLDSLQFVGLLAHVESEFGVCIPLADLELDRVSTLTALARLVRELMKSVDGPPHSGSRPDRVG